MILYTLPDCPNCERLKEQLAFCGVSFDERSLDDPESLTDLKINGCFASEAPILKIGNIYLGVL